jgi:hypothetical protein
MIFARASSFSSRATPSSKSSIISSAGSATALLIIFSLLPGTESIDRLKCLICVLPLFGSNFAWMNHSPFHGPNYAALLSFAAASLYYEIVRELPAKI